MLKRGIIIFSLVLLLSSVALAQDNLFSDIGDVELQEDAGLTPDNALYFLDDFFENLLINDDPDRALRYKEEKIAELRQMVEEGKIEEAEALFDKLEEYAEILEKEVSPELELRARESSKAIKEILDDLEDNIQGDEWEEVRSLVEEHEEKENDIAIAAKISTQIKELCKTLSELDPFEYERVCRTDEDDPRWHRELDEDLTDEQRQEAEEFFIILSECFENPRECRCQDISITAFAEQCSIIAPLAAECEEGNDEACNKLDDIEDPIDLLPDYLHDVFDRVEDRYDDSRHDLYIPEECKEANALTREECERVMFSIHAPEECVRALENGEIDISSERESRDACERIMFNTNAPQECIDAGLTDFRECGVLMFRNNAPQECIDAGLTGESRDDERKCREIVGDFRGEREGGFINYNCKNIENSEERLRCYDNAASGAEEYHEDRDPFEGWPDECVRENAFTPESCSAVFDKFREEEHDFEPYTGPSSCPEGQYIKCEGNNCWCADASEFGPPEQDYPEEPYIEPFLDQPFEEPTDEPHPEEPYIEPTPDQPVEEVPREPVPDTIVEPTPETAPELEPTPEPTPEPEPEPTPESDNLVTGEFFGINRFLDYYYR